MKPTWKVLGLLIAGGVIALTLHVHRAIGQEVTATTPDTHDQAMLAVSIIREINTAEVVDCREKDGNIDENMRFLPWDELLSAPCFKQMQSRMRGPNTARINESLTAGPEIVPGLELRLVISPDGKH